MRTTIDIPDTLYRELKVRAAYHGCSIKELVLRGVRAELQQNGDSTKADKIKFPVIPSKKPGWLKLSNTEIDEILFP
jgi:hypothetical protein